MRAIQPRLSAVLLALLTLAPSIPAPAFERAPSIDEAAEPASAAVATALPFDRVAATLRAQSQARGIPDADRDRVDDTLERLLEAAPAGAQIPFLARFPDADAAARGADALRAAGAGDVFLYHLIPVVAASLPAEVVRAVAYFPAVEHLHLDGIVQASLDSSAPLIRAPQARTQFGVDGRDVAIAILDTGIDPRHGALDDFDDDPTTADPKVIGWWSEYGDLAPRDGHGHGTHVAATAAGTGNGTAFVGIAPGASLVGVKVLSDAGSGTFAGVIRGIEWAVDRRDTLGIRIISMSLGASVPGDGNSPSELAVTAATAAGVLPVIANGNSGPGSATVGIPAAARDVLAVGAIDDLKATAFFSSRGPTADGRTKPEVAAPGVDVTAALAGTTSSYWELSGTSMATPHVSGLAALVLERSGFAMDAYDLRDLLMETAEDRGPAGMDEEYGAGVVDSIAAVDAATPRPLDAALVSLSVPPTVGPDRNVTIGAILRNSGTANLTNATVQLEFGGEVVDEVTVGFLAPRARHRVDLVLRAPHEWGTASFTVRVPPLPGEEYLLNNVRTGRFEVGLFLPTPRWLSAAAWNGSAAIVVGGTDGSEALDEILLYDPATGLSLDLDDRAPVKPAPARAAAAPPAVRAPLAPWNASVANETLTGALAAVGHALDEDGDKVQDALELLAGDLAATDTIPVLATFTGGDEARAAVAALKGLGGENPHAFSLVPVVAARLPASAIRAVALLPSLTRLSIDAPMQASLDAALPSITVPGARSFYGATGRGVGIAILDTGIDARHQMLDDFDDDPSTTDPKVTGWIDYIYGTSTPYDDNGHGTHVSAIAAGTANRTSWEGVAPGAHLVGAKVLNRFGVGFESIVIAAIEWTVENRETLDVQVLSMSLGADYWSDGTEPIELASTAAVRAGLVVTVANGNAGPNARSVGIPASARDVVAVGAVDDSHVVAEWSSRGPTKDGRIKPDVAAPGVGIVSARANSFSSIDEWSGTSMATPMVAGVAALMLDRSIHALDGDSVRELLKATASHPDSPNNVTGWGVVDAFSAVGLSEPRAHDLSIRPLTLGAWASPGDVVAVRTAVRNQGASEERGVVVRLLVDEVEVAQATIPNIPSRADAPVSLSWTAPEPKGWYALRVAVDAVPDETWTSNNARETDVRVALSLPTPRYGAAAVAVGDDVLVFGGAAPGWTTFRDIVRIDPVAGRVTTLGARLPYGLYSTASFFDGTYVWLLGGRGPSGWPDDRILRYDPAADVLTIHPTRLPRGLGDAALAWTGEVAYLVGGCYAVAHPSCESEQVVRFDPASGNVTLLSARYPGGLRGAAATWTGRSVQVVGGFHAYCCDPNWVNVVVGKAWRLDPATGAGAWLPEPLESALAFGSSVSTSQGLLVFGGIGSNLAGSRTVLQHVPTASEADALRAAPGPGLGRLAVDWGAPVDGPAPLGYRVLRTDVGSRVALAADDDGEWDYDQWFYKSWDVAWKKLDVPAASFAAARVLVFARADSPGYSPCAANAPNVRVLLNDVRVADVNPCTKWSSSAGSWATFPVPTEAVRVGINEVRLERLEPVRYVNSLNIGVDRDTNLGRSSFAFGGEFLIRLELLDGVAERAVGDVAAPGIALEGLPNATAYQHRVVPILASGLGPRGLLAEATTYVAVPPAAPAGLAARAGPGLGEVSLSWSLPPSTGAQPASYYRVHAGPAGAEAFVASTSATSAVVASLGDDTLRSFRVSAVNDVGESALSAAATARTFTRDEPAEPQALSIAPGPGFGEISLSWNPPLPNAGQPAQSYRLLRVEVGGDVLVATTSRLSAADSGLPHATSHSYRLEAVNDAGVGPAAGPVIGTTFGIPGAPTSLSATPGAARGAVALVWSAPSTGGPAPSSYRIYRAPSGGAFSFVAETTSKSHVEAGLPDASAFDWRIAGVNGAGEGPAASASATTWNAAPSGPPRNLRFVATPLGAAANLAWEAPAADGAQPPSGYKVYRGTTPSTLAFLATTPIAAYVDPGLADGAWYYRVTALNAAGESVGSNTASGMPSPGSLPWAASGTTSVWTGREAFVFGVSPGNSGKILRYDPATHATTRMEATLPGPRHHAAAIWDGRYAYIFGGSDYEYEGSTMICRYDPATDRVTVMRAKLPRELYGLSAVWTGRDVILLGGIGWDGYSGAIYKYTPATDSIAPIGNLPTPRAFGGAFYDGRDVWYFGGQSTGTRYSDVLKVSTSGPWTNVGTTPVPMDKMGVAWTGKYAYVFGGWVNERDWSNAIRRFDPVTRTWATMSETLPSERYAASAIWDGGSAYVFGGERGYGSTILAEIVRYRDNFPAAPRQLTAVTAGDLASIALSWQPPTEPTASPITAYRIYMGTSPGQESFLAEVGDVRAYTATGLAAGRRYYFKVSAVAGGVEGYLSSEASAATWSAIVPAVPPNFAVTAGPSLGQIRLSWSAASANGGPPVTVYRVYRGTSPGTGAYIGSVAPSTFLFWSDTGLAAGVTYFYTVTAVNEAGESAPTAERSARTFALVAPNTPRNVVARPDSASFGVHVQWSPPDPNDGQPVRRYRVFRGTSPTSESLVAEVTGTSFVDDDLEKIGVQHYRVSAVNDVGESLRSQETRAANFGQHLLPNLKPQGFADGSVAIYDDRDDDDAMDPGEETARTPPLAP